MIATIDGTYTPTYETEATVTIVNITLNVNITLAVLCTFSILPKAKIPNNGSIGRAKYV